MLPPRFGGFSRGFWKVNLFISVFVQVLMFSEEDCWIIFTLLAAILHLGNLRFQGKIGLLPNNIDTHSNLLSV